MASSPRPLHATALSAILHIEGEHQVIVCSSETVLDYEAAAKLERHGTLAPNATSPLDLKNALRFMNIGDHFNW